MQIFQRIHRVLLRGPYENSEPSSILIHIRLRSIITMNKVLVKIKNIIRNILYAALSFMDNVLSDKTQKQDSADYYKRRKSDGHLAEGRGDQALIRPQKHRLRNLLGVLLLYWLSFFIFYFFTALSRPLFFLISLLLLTQIISIIYFRQLFYQWRLSLDIDIAYANLVFALIIIYLAPPTFFLYGFLLAITIAFSSFRLSTARISIRVLIALLAYWALIACLSLSKRAITNIQEQMIYGCVLLLITPVYVVLATKIRHLQQALFRINSKVNNIEQHARLDELTGSYNRRYINVVLEQHKHFADTADGQFCVAMMDIDHFKRINDELGHLMGDEVLKIFARIVEQSVRSKDIFGRYGGEEFLLILPKTKLLDALNTSERIRLRIANYPWPDELQGRVTISTGVTQYVPSESIYELLGRADAALYLAKSGGRNQVIVQEASRGKSKTDP